LFGFFIIIWRKENNFLFSAQLGLLKLWDFLDLLFSRWTNSLRRETWCAKLLLCRRTENLPVFSLVKGVYYSQAELESQVCGISPSVKKCIRARVLVLCVLWLGSSPCYSGSARVAPIGMFVLITLAGVSV